MLSKVALFHKIFDLNMHQNNPIAFWMPLHQHLFQLLLLILVEPFYFLYLHRNIFFS